MPQTLAISQAITTIAQLRQKFQLVPASDPQFFTEWCGDLPELTAEEKAYLNGVHHRFLRHREAGDLAEGAANMLLVSPLLERAGFYDDPFFMTCEPTVEIVLEDGEESLRGRIDTLVFKQSIAHSPLWVLVTESKRTMAYSMAIPQAMAYMMAHPNPDRPLYGMVTSGDEFKFIKIVKQDPPQYDFSDTFSLLFFRENRLHDILCVLKKLRHAVLTNSTSECDPR